MDVKYQVKKHEVEHFLTEHAATFRGFTTPEEFATISVDILYEGDDLSVRRMLGFLVKFTDGMPSLHYTTRQVADLVIHYISAKHSDLSKFHMGYSFAQSPRNGAGLTILEFSYLELVAGSVPF